MADILLTLLSPGTPVQGITPSTPALTSTQVPSVLANLPPGTLIEGFVLNRDAKGNPVLRTAQGDFLIESDFFLKIGSDVVVRVNASGNATRANIVSVDGLPPQEAENIPAHASQEDVIVRSDQQNPPPAARATTPLATRAAAPQPATVPTPELAASSHETATLSGTLIQPTPTAAQSPQSESLSPGAALIFKLLNITLPSAAGQSTPDSPLTPEAVAAPPAANAVPSRLTLYNAYTHSAENNPARAAPSDSSPRAVSLQAKVVASEGPQQLIVQTPLGMVRFHAAPSFPPGTQLALELLQTTPERTVAQTRPASLPELAAEWESLRSIIDTLVSIDDETAVRFLRLALPSSAYGDTPQWKNLYPDARSLSNGMTFFLAALSGGNLREWLGGRAARVLEDHGHAPLLARAEAEFSSLRSLYADAPPGQWQALFLPIMAEGEIRPLRYFVKRNRKGKGRERETTGDTRFIVEMELSSTGALQLDGFFRKHDSGTQFDLVIRSQNAFTAAMQRDIQAIYISVGEATGYKGAVSFQQSADFPVKPLEEILADPHGGVVV